MIEQCIKCKCEVPEDSGFETTRGDVLCGPCFLALWKPRSKDEVSEHVGRLRPANRRVQLGRPVWVRGAL